MAFHVRKSVKMGGPWSWTSTVVGLSPLDGQILSGTLRMGTQSWSLTGWWEQIPIPNPTHKDLTLTLDLPNSRKIQLQKWEQ